MLGYLQKLKRILCVNLYQPRNEDGFLLVVTLAILVVLTIIGVSAITLTRTELQIAGNDLIHKETFFQADGGTDLAIALVEENCGTNSDGFTKVSTVGSKKVLDGSGSAIVVEATGLKLAANGAARTAANVSDAGRDIAYFPDGYTAALADTPPHTNIIVDGVTSLAPGSGAQQLGGYEGIGKGTAGLGGQTIFTIFSQHMGRIQSQSLVAVTWRHVIGLEITGHY